MQKIRVNKRGSIVYSALVLFCLSMMSASVAWGQTKVVVIPLFGDDIPAPVPEPKIVFVSAEQPDFDFGGVTGADSICEGEANAIGAHSSLDGKEFKAWLYDTDTDTFHGDAPTPGMRSFNIPEGQLLSPTGQSFDAASTHFLTTGSSLPDIECDSSGSISDCVSEYKSVLPLEGLDGEEAYTESSSSRILLALPSPAWSPRTTNSHNCEEYTNVGQSPAHLGTMWIILIEDNLFQEILTTNETFRGNCQTSVSLFCVEQ